MTAGEGAFFGEPPGGAGVGGRTMVSGLAPGTGAG